MVYKHSPLIRGVVLLISLSGIVCQEEPSTKSTRNSTISAYSDIYAANIWIAYQLLIMAEKPEINLTLYESAKTIRATEKEFQVKWALDYLNAANDTWKLEKNQFVNTTNSYLRCTVLNKYTEWKWKNRTELDLLAIKQLNDVNEKNRSEYRYERGFDYKVAKEKYSHAQRMKKICLDNAWDKCLLAVKANLEYEQVKDTNSSSMKKEILEKKERSLKKALVLEPIERVNTVVELMESEVEYNIGAC
ncbi:secretory glycoprotein k5 precursor [Schistosoma japonicum]|nr:secretory glycoprotein k5 precursor [Schistosoma japonicum]KAH8876203.1 secretory glycoprotein k5 precursor [Schistosoma japonicum]